jgi:hypothetical protein
MSFLSSDGLHDEAVGLRIAGLDGKRRRAVRRDANDANAAELVSL